MSSSAITIESLGGCKMCQTLHSPRNAHKKLCWKADAGGISAVSLPARQRACVYLCISIVHGVIRGVSNSLKVDHPDLLGLPNPVSPGNGLFLVLGVGVGVIHHHRVGCLQVEAPAGCPDAQQEDEDLAVGGVEALDGSLPGRSTSCLQPCFGLRVSPCITVTQLNWLIPAGTAMPMVAVLVWPRPLLCCLRCMVCK